MYIPDQTYSPTLRPKGAQKPSNLHTFPKCWQFISNTNIFLLQNWYWIYSDNIWGIWGLLQNHGKLGRYLMGPTIILNVKESLQHNFGLKMPPLLENFQQFICFDERGISYIREGCTNENPEKVWSFAKLPSKKKLPPFFC